PKTGSAFWRAARADAGVMATLGDNLAALLRAGVAVPLVAPPAFVLDETDVVYRPSRLTLRLTAGLVLGF
ncbi:MAG TPA: hypothetical protein VLA79_09725, partial [Polyangia bacterium]|nr:hypothetical protein [Polyangia bacterium]